MTAEIRFFLSRLLANYWFFPAVFAIAAAFLAVGTVYLDRSGFSEPLTGFDWLVPVGPTGASDILTVIASSMIAVASTVFSITIVAVSYASSTYGPRLLTNFLDDRGNQVSLAAFIGTFVYALVVLRSVRAENEVSSAESLGAAGTPLPGFAPQMSLLVAYILLIFCVGVLVFFLNHVPSSIRINKVLEQIGRRLLALIAETYPEENEFADDAREPQGGVPVPSRGAGYVQMIDFELLCKQARSCGGTISLCVRTGDFVHRDLPLMQVSGCDPSDIEQSVHEAFTLGSDRTPNQDPQFLIDELVEIGLRALSPGINDPFTAITALHWMGASISEIGRRDLRKHVGGEELDEDVVIPLVDNFSHYAERSFGSIRSGVSTSPTAARIMLDVLENACVSISHRPRIETLRDQARKLAEQARLSLSGPDLELIEDRFREFETSTSA